MESELRGFRQGQSQSGLNGANQPEVAGPILRCGNGSAPELEQGLCAKYWQVYTGRSHWTGGGLNVYQYAYNDPLVYIDPSGEIPVAPIILGYLRCVARCTARATAWDALTGEIDCWPDTL